MLRRHVGRLLRRLLGLRHSDDGRCTSASDDSTVDCPAVSDARLLHERELARLSIRARVALATACLESAAKKFRAYHGPLAALIDLYWSYTDSLALDVWARESGDALPQSEGQLAGWIGQHWSSAGVRVLWELVRIPREIGEAEILCEPTAPSISTLEPLKRIIGIAVREGIPLPQLDCFLADPYSDEGPWGRCRYRDDFAPLQEAMREECRDCPVCSLELADDVPRVFRQTSCPRCGHVVRIEKGPKGTDIVVVTVGSDVHARKMKSLEQLSLLANRVVLDFSALRRIDSTAIMAIGGLASSWCRSETKVGLRIPQPQLREIVEQTLKMPEYPCPVTFYEDLASAVMDDVA